MTDLRPLIESLKTAIETRRLEIALGNGTSRDRGLDQYRFASGQCAGLAEAQTVIDETMKQLIEGDDD